MALFTPTFLETERLVLRLVEPGHAAPLTAFQSRNREHFGPWDPPRPPDFYTEDGWAQRIAGWVQEEKDGRASRWCCFPKTEPDLIVATVNLSEIARGWFQACYLGFAVDVGYQGTGTMSEAVTAVVDHAFETLQLHRIMAGYVPENVRSAKLLERLAFRVEGHATEYLFINGAWRDHVLTARVNPNSQPLE